MSEAPQTSVQDTPKVDVHRVEFSRVLDGLPVAINPSVGDGMKVMSVEEWAGRWKRSDEFPECLACGSVNTKEHAYSQTWCHGARSWEAESLCLACLRFSWRAHTDAGFKTPAQHEKARWQGLLAEQQA